MPAKDERHIRWWAIGVVSLAGIAITALPFALARWVDRNYGTWESLVSSALTNVGTAILLVAVVFLVERGLVRRVREVARQQATTVVDERTQELTESNRELSIRIDALQSQLEQSVADEDSERRARVDRLATDVSFDAVADALEEANDLQALAFGDITVPASAQTDSPRINISWCPRSSRGSHRDLDNILLHGTPTMALQYDATDSPSSGIGSPVVEVVWEPRQSPIEALQALRDEMRRKGFVDEATLVGDKLFLHLHAALTDALDARIGSETAWAHGAMIEWLADGWAVTERGLVSRDHGSIESDAFRRTPTQKAYGVEVYRGDDAFAPPAPAGVEADFWSFALERARSAHAGAWPSLPRGGPVAYTPTTSPRRRTDWNQ